MNAATKVTTKITLDTNILIYAIDSSQGKKHLLAGKLLLKAASGRHPLMLQALNEFAAVVRKKRLMSLSTLKKIIDYHRSAFVLEPPVIDDLIDAVQANEDHNLPVWDALLWATARRSGCKIIFSEDFQDGREIGGVRFVNPFKLTPRQLQDFIE
jgi:predicted nucleic acid-binding protein